MVNTTWSFLDLVAVGELARAEEALHAGAQLDLVDRGGAADELRLVGDRPLLGGLHQHGRRRRALLGACRAAGEQRQHACREERPMPSNADLSLSSPQLVLNVRTLP